MYAEGEYSGEQSFGEYQPEWGELQEAEQGELEAYAAELQELSGEYGSPLGEQEEMELAAQLLEVRDEAELEQFLGGLIKSVAKGVGGFIDSPTGKALGGILKNVAKKALPVVGGAIGSFVAPGIGTAIGTRLGSMATKLFEVEIGELEALSQDEAEFEVARRYVRFSASAARNAALAPRRGQPQRVARASTFAAARRHARGVARSFPSHARPARWYGHRRPQQAPTGYPPVGYAPWPYPMPSFPPPYADQPAPFAPPSAGPPSNGHQAPAAKQGGTDDSFGSEPADSADAPPPGEQEEGGGRRSHERSGRWIRRGGQIVVLGA